MQHQRGTAGHGVKHGVKHWNTTSHSWETLYGHEDMLMGSEERNQAIMKAQTLNNGGLDDKQTDDLMVILGFAHEWLIQTKRQHMLGSFDMRGLYTVTPIVADAAALPEGQLQQPTS